MNLPTSRLYMGLFVALSIASASAQKVKVGYDNSVDFKRYTSYTLAEPGSTPTRPMLYATVVGSIDHQLQSKGLTKTQKDGDLILIPAGGMEFGLNTAAGTPILGTYSASPPAIDATMWTGAGGSSGSAAMSVPEGTLMLNFIDRSANKVIWTGTVSVKLDMEQKQKSLDLVDKAIAKLLKEFPPEKK